MRRIINTFDELRDQLNTEKYICVYRFPNRKSIYDLYYRLEDGSSIASNWACERSSNSLNSCHFCGEFYQKGVNDKDHQDCQYKILRREDVLKELKEVYEIEDTRVEAISYIEHNEFYHRFNKIIKAFRSRDGKVSFSGKELKLFMVKAMDFIIGSQNIKLKKSINRTIKVYSKYPLGDKRYYFVTKDKFTKNFTFRVDRSKEESIKNIIKG